MNKKNIIIAKVLQKLNKKLTEKELDTLEKELYALETHDKELNQSIADFSGEVVEDPLQIAKKFWDNMAHLAISDEDNLKRLFDLMKRYIKPIFDKYSIPVKWDIKEFEDAVVDYRGGLDEQQYERDYYSR